MMCSCCQCPRQWREAGRITIAREGAAACPSAHGAQPSRTAARAGTHVLQYGLRKAQETLKAASRLLGKLSGEKQSWHEQADAYTSALPALPARATLAAACIVYAAATPEDTRAELMHAWQEVPGLQQQGSFWSASFLASEHDLAEWRSWGLPGDEVRACRGSCMHALCAPYGHPQLMHACALCPALMLCLPGV
jgi:hypothetical protein